MTDRTILTDAALEAMLARRAGQGTPVGLIASIDSALDALPGDRRPWWTVLAPPVDWSPALRLAWMVAVVGLLLAATVSAVYVGSELLGRRPSELAVVPAPSAAPTVAPAPSASPSPSETLSPLVLTRVGGPVVEDTALGTITWRHYEIPSNAELDLSSMVDTPHGPVTAAGTMLLWLRPDGTLERMPLPEAVWGLAPVGDGLISYGGGQAGRGHVRPISWNESGWVVGDALEVPRPLFSTTNAVVSIAAGPRGVVIVSCQPDGCRESSDGVAVAADGRHFVAGQLPPGGGNGIGPILAVEDGFVAIVSTRQSGLQGNYPSSYSLVEPRLWFSTDGLAWEPASPVSPFGEGAWVSGVAGRVGRWVAVGNIGTFNGPWAVWVSDDGLAWERLSDLPFERPSFCSAIDGVSCRISLAAGERGWVIVTENDSFPVSADGRTWKPLTGADIRGDWGLPRAALSGDSIVVWYQPHVAVGTIEASRR